MSRRLDEAELAISPAEIGSSAAEIASSAQLGELAQLGCYLSLIHI